MLHLLYLKLFLMTIRNPERFVKSVTFATNNAHGEHVKLELLLYQTICHSDNGQTDESSNCERFD